MNSGKGEKKTNSVMMRHSVIKYHMLSCSKRKDYL